MSGNWLLVNFTELDNLFVPFFSVSERITREIKGWFDSIMRMVIEA